MISLFGYLQRALNGKADKQGDAQAAEEARARRERDSEMFSELRQIKEGVGEVKVDVATLTLRVGSIENVMQANGRRAVS